MESQREISTIIEKLLHGHNTIATILQYSIDEEYDDRTILTYINRINDDLLFLNSAVARRITDYCQLLNEKTNFKEVSLKQIEEIYRVLSKVNPFDIGFYESLAFYLSNVQNNPEEARSILGSGISIIEKRIAGLK